MHSFSLVPLLVERDGRRDFEQQIEVRCWDSIDAREAKPNRLPFELLEQLAREIIGDVLGVVSVTYNLATRPPSTIEAVLLSVSHHLSMAFSRDLHYLVRHI